VRRGCPAAPHDILRLMRHTVTGMFVRLVGVALLLQCAATAEVIRFDDGAPGTLPRGWSAAMTHEGSAPRWEIVRDESAPSPPYVLAQLSRDRTAGRFPLAIWERIVILNGHVSVASRPWMASWIKQPESFGATKIPTTTISPALTHWKTTWFSTRWRVEFAFRFRREDPRRGRMASSVRFRADAGTR